MGPPIKRLAGLGAFTCAWRASRPAHILLLPDRARLARLMSAAGEVTFALRCARSGRGKTMNPSNGDSP
jgi:hypothetical protein